MDLFHRFVHWVVLFTFVGHIFCCGLPLVVSFLSVIVGLGLLSGVLPALDHVHHVVHGYETGLVIFSGVMLALGWIAQWASTRLDCHDTGCDHPPCDTKKVRNARILGVATALFMFNLIVLLVSNHTAVH